jgi:hypothetical protein
MSSIGRSIVLLVPIFVVMVHSPSSAAQAGNAQSQVAAPAPTPSATGTGSNPKSHRGQKREQDASSAPPKSTPQPAAPKGKVQVSSGDGKANRSLLVGNIGVSATPKARPKSFWQRVTRLTSGTARANNDSRWQRSQETSGP